MDKREAAIAAQVLLSEQSTAGAVVPSLPRIMALIPTALDSWCEFARTNRQARALLRTTVTVSVSGGTADLTPKVNGTTNQIDLEELQSQNVTVYALINSTYVPCTWLASKMQLNQARQMGGDTVAIFLDGYTLRTRNTDGLLTSFSGSLQFQARDYPATVEAIPAQLVEGFVLMLAELAGKKLTQ